MLSIIFNNDGSIKTLIVGESIQQGDHETKQIFASIEGYENSEYEASCEFVLPNGELSELSGVAETDVNIYGRIYDAETHRYEHRQTYDGFSFTLTEAQTLYAGILKANIKLINLQGAILCTYQVELKINPTGYNPNETHITEAQYNSLLQSLKSDYQTLVEYFPSQRPLRLAPEGIPFFTTLVVNDVETRVIVTKIRIADDDGDYFHVFGYNLDLHINYSYTGSSLKAANSTMVRAALNTYCTKEEYKIYRHSLVFAYHSGVDTLYYGCVEIITSFKLNITISDLVFNINLSGSYVAVLANASSSSVFDGPAVLFQTRYNENVPYIIKNGVPYYVDEVISDTVVEI